MKRKYFYLLLLLLLLMTAFLAKQEFTPAESATRGKTQMEKAEGWNGAVAAFANKSPIRLYVDGKEVKVRGKGPYMTDSIKLMLPTEMFKRAFYCAVSIYDEEILILQKNESVIELEAGKTHMKVNGITMELETGIEKRGDYFYLPIEVAVKALGYSTQWMAEENSLTAYNITEEERFLPYRYDYRDYDRSPLVKNQGSLGTCWAFASLGALKSTLLPREDYNFSENHMSVNNSFGLTQNDGGEYTMSMAYLLSWQGPVLEKDAPYGKAALRDDLEPVKHVQEIQMIPSKDLDEIKKAVFLYGGVQSSLYTSLKNEKSRSVFFNKETNSYCYIGPEKPNHDVVIVGWDDSYSRDNFNMALEGDGAFLCLNSWGEGFGDQGYFYVSYYDTNIGFHNILYSRIEEPDNYDRIYQSDLCGWIGQLGYGKENAYFANVYQTKERERLEAAGFYATGPNTEYEIYVVRHANDEASLNNRELLVSGKLVNTGYYTIPFPEGIELDAGERFAVVVNIKTPGAIHPIAIEYAADASKSNVDLSDGEGYISLRGRKWERTEETQSCNLCLKAYTVVLEEEG